ncbi:MAG: MarR family transcriptional regulator [Phaeodactylibacter sp.]|nr:MarR family transcriptional regulator [Phaeodactylibacter sp.]
MKSEAALTQLERTVFYALEKAIKSYRQFAQRNIDAHNLNITIDQWLILKTIKDHPDLMQKEIAQRVFKDLASVTRMVELLVKRKYLKRSFHEQDRRRYKLELTPSGNQIYNQLVPIVLENRKTALEGIPSADIADLHDLLHTITENCQSTSN